MTHSSMFKTMCKVAGFFDNVDYQTLGLGGLAAPALVGNIGSQAYIKGVDRFLKTPSDSAKVKKDYDKLYKHIKGNKVAIRGQSSPRTSRLNTQHASKSLLQRFRTSPAWAGAYYDPKKHSISISRNAPPGILAHEAGHAEALKGVKEQLAAIEDAKQMRKFKGSAKRAPITLKTRQIATLLGSNLGRRVGALGSLGALGSKDEDFARNSAILGTLGGGSHLLTELDASNRGAKMMRKLKLPGRWSAFSGVPTYALGAAIPGLMYGSKKYFGGYNTPATASKPTPLEGIRKYLR